MPLPRHGSSTAVRLRFWRSGSQRAVDGGNDRGHRDRQEETLDQPQAYAAAGLTAPGAEETTPAEPALAGAR
jgi:hypothetical protein